MVALLFIGGLNSNIWLWLLCSGDGHFLILQESFRRGRGGRYHFITMPMAGAFKGLDSWVLCEDYVLVGWN